MDAKERNQRIIDMVIARAERDFPDSVALIGLTGSAATGDTHPMSDVDLVIILNDERGRGIETRFILDGVGYDIYCAGWDGAEAESELESPMVSHLVDLKVLYCPRADDRARFDALRERALGLLAAPVGAENLARAEYWLGEAKKTYADACLARTDGRVRYAAAGCAYYVMNAVTAMNNDYLRRGIKRYEQELLGYKYLPQGFAELYHEVIGARGADGLRAASLALLRSAEKLLTELRASIAPETAATDKSLAGTFEELWSNYHNKIADAARSGDGSYMLLTALGAQNYFDEMSSERGAPRLDIMSDFDAERPETLTGAYAAAEREYLAECVRAGVKVREFASFDELYRDYMA